MARVGEAWEKDWPDGGPDLCVALWKRAARSGLVESMYMLAAYHSVQRGLEPAEVARATRLLEEAARRGSSDAAYALARRAGGSRRRRLLERAAARDHAEATYQLATADQDPERLRRAAELGCTKAQWQCLRRAASAEDADRWLAMLAAPRGFAYDPAAASEMGRAEWERGDQVEAVRWFLRAGGTAAIPPEVTSRLARSDADPRALHEWACHLGRSVTDRFPPRQ